MAIKGISVDGAAVRNESGSAMSAGDLVYVSGYDATGAALVLLADADDVTKKAEYVLVRALADTSNDYANIAALETDLNTSGATIGDDVYLSDTAGGWTLSVLGTTKIVQVVGIVTVVSSTIGQIQFRLLGPADTHNSTTVGRAGLNDGTAAAQATTLGLGTGDDVQFSGLTIATKTQTGLSTESLSAAIVANANSTQLDTPLTTDVNNITTCVGGGDAVTLPTAVVGQVIRVRNVGDEAADIFPFTSDTIDGGSANAAISLPLNADIFLVATTASAWVSFGVGQGQNFIRRLSAAITANANSAQLDTPLTSDVNNISTCATAGDAVTLPTAVAGLVKTVRNVGVAAADVFPFTSDTIDGVAADTAYSLPVGADITFVALSTTAWVSVGVGKGQDPYMPIAFSDGLVAKADGTQEASGASTVVAAYQVIGTVAGGIIGGNTGTLADAVTLPVAVPGMEITLENETANDCAVFPNTSGIIGGKGVNAAISLDAYGLMTLRAKSVTEWEVTFIRPTCVNSITADTNSAVATAVFLGGSHSIVTVSGADTHAVVLPPIPYIGFSRVVQNDDAAQDVDVFPYTGDTINGGGANAAEALGEAKTTRYVADTLTNWVAIILR